MVSSGTVKSDLSTMMGYFSSYTSTMESIDNPSVWEGESKDSTMQQAEAFANEYKGQISSQMSTFAEALDNYEKLKQLKEDYNSAYNSWETARNNNNASDESFYREKCNAITKEKEELKTKIKEELSTVSSQKLSSATELIEKYPNLFTLNEFVYYNQGDYHNAYAAETIAAAGCGPTSAAMVLTYLTGETHDPVEVANYSTKHGYACDYNGTYEALFPAISQEYGLNCTQQSQTSENIINSLSQGNVIIAHMGPGHFTRGGHYIVLKGLDENGKVIVADPNNGRTNGSWDASIIASESKGSMYSISV